MFTALMILQVLLGLSIIGLVLLQQGKGADMGAAFGAGAAGTVFGARGGGSFFTRATAILAAVFFINSILVSSPLGHEARDPAASVTSVVPAVEETDIPVVEEDVEVDPAMDLPPADLADVETTIEEAAGDLPEVSEDAEAAADAAPTDAKPE